MTPAEAVKYFSAYSKKVEQEIKKIDVTNFILGKYVMYAVNDPKKYPDKPLTQEDVEIDDGQEMGDSDRARLDAMFGSLAAQSKTMPTPNSDMPQNGSEKPKTQKS